MMEHQKIQRIDKVESGSLEHIDQQLDAALYRMVEAQATLEEFRKKLPEEGNDKYIVDDQIEGLNDKMDELEEFRNRLRRWKKTATYKLNP